ncbi:MAG: hypothetical protein LH468_05265 [Nocardioides sp.]|nr:hypothetical protein [Nocardioides sp.]
MTDHAPEHDELGAKPEPEIEPAEVNPGGVDAMPSLDGEEVVPADLTVESNPAVDAGATPELAEGEDTSTQATRDEDPPSQEESPV